MFEFADENEKNKPRAAFFHFGTSIHLPPDKDIYLSDIQFYNNEILSVLLSCGGDSSIFLQLCVNLLREELVPVVSRRGFISPDFAFVPSVLHPSNVRSVDASAYIEPTSFRLFQDFQVFFSVIVQYDFRTFNGIVKIVWVSLRFVRSLLTIFTSYCQ